MILHQKTLLPGGLRLLTAPSKNTEAITVLVLVGAGARYETKDTSGVAHFLEHMFFKGAKRYKQAKDVSEAIDSVGGEFNAFTGKEYVGYYIKVAKQHLTLALDVLSDMLLHSKLDAKEIERERGVILEEINMYEDSPMSKVEEEFEGLMYGDHQLGWKIAGPKPVILKLNRAQFKNYQDRFYTPDNIVISIAGNFSRPTVLKQVGKYFRFPKKMKVNQWTPYFPTTPKSHVRLVQRATEQAHLFLGVPGLTSVDPRRYVGNVLAAILGGGMSSRMFVSVRERQGLCYYISSSFSYYADAGHLETRAGVDLKRVEQAVTAILKEYKRIKTELVTPKELTKAKEFLKGQTTLRMEASDEVAEFLGKQELLYNHIETLPTVFKRIDAVTASEVLKLAKELLRTENLRFAVIGPYTNSSRFEKLLTL